MQTISAVPIPVRVTQIAGVQYIGGDLGLPVVEVAREDALDGNEVRLQFTRDTNEGCKWLWKDILIESIQLLPRLNLAPDGIWERLHNPDFNPVEFDGIRKQEKTGENRLV